MISIIFSTNRVEPKFNWFIDSLALQTSEDVELIIIDYCKDERGDELEKINQGRFNIIHEKPKQNSYQGKNRKTKTEFFSPSNARNTGAALSNSEYLVFVDDVSVLMPTWFQSVVRARNNNQVVCGAYQKHYNMIVENGKIISSRFEKLGNDSRWDSGKDNKAVRIPGGSLFGCSLGIPKEVFDSVEGFDEICDSIGGEDYHLGIRLNHAGYSVYYDRSMFSVESEELHSQAYVMLRDDRVLEPKEYLDRLKFFGVRGRSTQGNWDSSHMILDILYSKNQKKSLHYNYESHTHWFDNRELKSL